MAYLSLFVIMISFIVQLISAFVALQLIVYSKKPTAGVLMLVGTALMAFRRAISLHRIMGNEIKIDLAAEITACIISFVLLVGFLYLSRLVTDLEQETDKRAETEETLKETTARLEALIHAIPDIVVFKNAEGRHLVVNKAAELFIGLPAAELLGKTNDEILPPDIAVACSNSDKEATDSLHPVQSEEKVVNKSGTIFLDTIKSPIFDDRGSLKGLVTVSRDITNRKHAEENIIRLSRQKELILNAAGEGIYGLDPEGNITFINPAGAKMVGWTIEELIGRSSHDIIHHTRPNGSFYPVHDCPLHQSLKTGATYNVQDELFWRKDGSSFPVDYVSTPIKQEDKVVGAVIVYKDVTARKQKAEELSLDQRRLNSLFKISQQKSALSRELLSVALEEAIALSDSSIGYLFYYDEEKALFTLHTRSREAIKGCRIPDPPTLYELSKTGIWGEAVRQRGPVIVNEYGANLPGEKGLPEGHLPVFRLMTLPVFSDDRIVAVVGVANKKAAYTDLDARQLDIMMDSIWKIAERKLADEALRMSEERLRLALTAANQGLYDLDVQTGEAEVSPEYATMLNYDPAEFRETNARWIERLHPADRERVTEVYRDYIAGRTPIYSVEFRQKTGTDEWKWILSLGKIVQWDAGGKPLRMVGTHTDITERRKLLDQLEHLNRDLAERVREEIEKNRTKEQLMQLQNRHAAMGEMIDNIGHQWRQPLNNLGLMLQGMHRKFKEGSVTPEIINHNVKIGMSMIQYMSQTINDFTNFFRHDKMMVKFKVKDVVTTAISFMETSLKRNAIAVVSDIPEDIAIEGYRNEYSQVLVNILNNAKDVFVERGTQKPTITLYAFKAKKASVLTIADNGGGIPGDLMGRIFTPYFTTKAENKGTGIGLYMSKMIIEKNMNGRLSACNKGSGAEFRIEVQHGE